MRCGTGSTTGHGEPSAVSVVRGCKAAAGQQHGRTSGVRPIPPPYLPSPALRVSSRENYWRDGVPGEALLLLAAAAAPNSCNALLAQAPEALELRVPATVRATATAAAAATAAATDTAADTATATATASAYGAARWSATKPMPCRKPAQGLIFTAGSIYRVLHALNIPIHVQEVRPIPRKRRGMHAMLRCMR